MIRFAAPEWFLLLPVLAFAIWRWRKSARPFLRGACLLLLLLLLVRPQVRKTARGLDLWVLADRSGSAAASVEPHLAEWETILERSKNPEDRLYFIDYAAEAALRDHSAGVALTGDRNGTRTALAANYALSLTDPGRSSRLLVLSDGFSTEPFGALEERLRKEGIPLDCRLATEGNVRDYRVESLGLPMRAQPGEPFLIEVRVNGPGPAQVPFEITRDGTEIVRGSVEIPANSRIGMGLGFGVARFTDRVITPGGRRYAVRITPAEDAHPGNNTAEQWMEITGGPRVLLVTGYQDDPLAESLRAQGFEVEVVTDPATLNVGKLQGARAVILNNVPAFKLPPGFLQALDFFVRDQSGGLLMAGGKMSFGCGGYFGSPIADLLPVSMELRQEHRKLAVAMAIVLDRSGSMAAPAGGQTKMDLADAGAARAVELLGPMDEVAVFAVDTKPHVIVPLSSVGQAAKSLGDTIRRITSGGGGIFVYTGLKAAYEALQQSPRGQRHVILFADAADAEEPGDYKELLKKMEEEETTVSVIGLGTENDSDAAFLKDVAARGKGRIFFTKDATELPAIFEQETVAVARSAFLDQPTPLKALPGWAELAARPLGWLGSVEGYNLSYLRPEATAAAITGDDESAPLVAFWQRGTGRAAAVSFPLAGDFSAGTRGWAGYGDFVQTLARWLMGEALLPGIGLRATVEGTQLNADLLFDPSWENALSQTPPRLVLAGTKADERNEIIWERMEPGRYRATASLTPGQTVRGAVQIGESTLPFGPLQAGLGAEWAMDPAKRAELVALAHASGGMERGDLASVWNAPRRAEFADLRQWILPTLLLLFLLESLLARLGGTVKLPDPGSLASAALKKARPTRKTAPIAEAIAVPVPEPPKEEEPKPEVPATDRRDRFRRAKRGL